MQQETSGGVADLQIQTTCQLLITAVVVGGVNVYPAEGEAAVPAPR